VIFFLIPSLRAWQPGLLLDHPPSLPFFSFFLFFLSSFFLLSFLLFLFLSFSHDIVSINIVTQLIPKDTKYRDRNRPCGTIGRRKRDGSHFPCKNKVVQDLEQNEENGDPDSNKTKINYIKEPNEDHKNILKEEFYK
jgi:hypothetical protein